MSTPEKQEVVSLNYRRDGKAYTFSGSILPSDLGTGEYFCKLSFEEVMSLVSRSLKLRPNARLLVKREEAPYPMTLPPDIENLLRTDFPAAMQALSIGPQRIVIGVPRQINMGGLTHGFDTLAGALGEEIYVKFRFSSAGGAMNQIEDPITGRWMEATATTPERLSCNGLVYTRQIIDDGHRWCTVKTEDILALNYPRYYLPRAWNPGEGWISHIDLETMYEVYKKEKNYES